MKDPPRFYLGIDAGASRCKLRIRDADDALLAEAETGAASPYAGRGEAFAALDAVIAEGMARAGLAESDLPAISAGIASAGVSRKNPVAGFSAWRSPFGRTRFEVDIFAAWLGALGGADGSVISLGTGTAALSVAEGRRHFLSGYGFILYDLGSAAWAGRRTMQHALAAADGTGPATPLTERVLERFGGDPEQIALWALSASPSDFGGFAPWVTEAADKGDEIALAILRAAAADIDALIERAEALSPGPVSLLGGFAGVMAPYLARGDALKPPIADALEGALMLARGEGSFAR